MVRIASRPVLGRDVSPDSGALLLVTAVLLLLSLPALYAFQAVEIGTPGLVAHAVLSTGLLLLVVVAAKPLLYPTLRRPSSSTRSSSCSVSRSRSASWGRGDDVQAGVLPRPASMLLARRDGGLRVRVLRRGVPAADRGPAQLRPVRDPARSLVVVDGGRPPGRRRSSRGGGPTSFSRRSRRSPARPVDTSGT